MKIEAITLREIHMPLVHFFETSFGRTTERRILLIILHTDGPEGWGECVAGEDPFYSEESVVTLAEIPCGVSIGIQNSVEQLLEKIETELSAGYRRIKVKCKPGWDVQVFEKILARWTQILLSCDANS